MNGSGRWFAEQAWLGYPATNVLIIVQDGQIANVTPDAERPADATLLSGWTLPGLANAHSHAFQRALRGSTHTQGADFWSWRDQMYSRSEWEPDDYYAFARSVFREMLLAGITAVGEFHYLHAYGNRLGEALIAAAQAEGIRITLIDACYLRAGLSGQALDPRQKSFSDGSAGNWATRMDCMHDSDGVRIAAAIHSVRAVDPPAMRVVADYARTRQMPLHIHLAEQIGEVVDSRAATGCSPVELLNREGILGPDLVAVHAINLAQPDAAMLGRHGVTICTCTTTERDLGDAVGPIAALARAGCQLAVGTDSNAVIDIFEEARGMELDQRRARGRRVFHHPDQLLDAATLGGMRALGWNAGELAEGRLADFITVAAPLAGPGELTSGNLVFSASAGQVTNVVVGGRTVVTGTTKS